MLPLPYTEDEVNDKSNIVSIELEDGAYSGQLVGDLVVYNNWGVWHVAHYPTQTRFDDAEKGAVPLGDWSKEQLLSWCDRVQMQYGQLWAILRELTPENYDAKSDIVLRAKDQIRSYCLSVNVE